MAATVVYARSRPRIAYVEEWRVLDLNFETEKSPCRGRGHTLYTILSTSRFLARRADLLPNYLSQRLKSFSCANRFPVELCRPTRRHPCARDAAFGPIPGVQGPFDIQPSLVRDGE